MWYPSDFPQARSSFQEPVPPPNADPTAGPCVCVSFNQAWLPYVLGALNQLVLPAAWKVGDQAALDTVQQQAQVLIEMFAVSSACSSPPPAPIHPPGEDIDCKIASYLVRTAVKEILQSAINFVAEPGAFLGILEHIVDFIPGVGDFIGIAGLSARNAAYIIGLNPLVDWAEDAASEAAWNAIGCTVYAGVKGIHQFTDDNLGPIIAAIKDLAGIDQAFLDAVAGVFGDLGKDVLNGLADMADVTEFDCSACDGSPPVITGTDPQIYAPRALELTDGTHDLKHVGKLTVAGATVGGTADAATLSIPTGGVHVSENGEDQGVATTLDFLNAEGVAWVIGSGESGTLDVSLDLSGGASGLGQSAAHVTVDTALLYSPPPAALQWTVLCSVVPAPGTYLAQAVADFAATGGAADVVLAVKLAGLAVAGGEAYLAGTGSTSIPTAPVLMACDGVASVTLEALADQTGVIAHAASTIGAVPLVSGMTLVGSLAATWCYSWNFRAGDGGWEAYNTGNGDRAVYVPGVGWHSVTPFGYAVAAILRSFSPDRNVTSLTIEYTATLGGTGGNSFIILVLGNNNQEVLTFTLEPGASTETLSSVVADTDELFTELVGPLTTDVVVITRATVTGVGQNPFGLSNC